MNSPISWIGGKSRLANTIVDIIPPHRQYAEVFCGAGWIFFRKEPSRVESINDINGDLIAFYRVLQNHLEEFCKQFKWLLASRELFKDFKAQSEAGGLTDIQRAARFYYQQRLAFGGRVIGRTYGTDKSSPPRLNLVRMEEELSQVHLRLSRVTIENLSWQDYLKRYDHKDTFFYLDPPYWGTEGYYGKGLFSRSEYEEMADILSSLEGKFLLSLNDVPEVRSTFKSFNIKNVSTQYSCNKGAPKEAKEVLIKNYELSS